MRTAHFLAALAALSLSPACGGVTSDDTTSGTANSSSDATSGAAGSGASAGAGGSDTTAPGGSGGTAGTSETTGSGDTTSTTTASPEPFIYALYVNGRYPSLRVYKSDPANNRCTIIWFVDTSQGGGDDPDYAAVERPAGWGLQTLIIVNSFEECFDPHGAPEGLELESATSASGAASWEGGLGGVSPPDVMDIDLALTFPQEYPWAPAEETVFAVGLPVTVD
jgi:hypothetical protein